MQQTAGPHETAGSKASGPRDECPQQFSSAGTASSPPARDSPLPGRSELAGRLSDTEGNCLSQCDRAAAGLRRLTAQLT